MTHHRTINNIELLFIKFTYICIHTILHTAIKIFKLVHFSACDPSNHANEDMHCEFAIGSYNESFPKVFHWCSIYIKNCMTLVNVYVLWYMRNNIEVVQEGAGVCITKKGMWVTKEV